MNESVPLNPAFGVYVTSPVVGFTVTVPFVGLVTIVTLASLIEPSVSVSLLVTSIKTAVSSFVVAMSSTAFGASLIGVTVIIKVSFTQIAGRGVPLSQTETTIVS